MRKNSCFKIGILRACPFCGETPKVVTRMMNHAYEIYCDNEKCVVRPTTGVHSDLDKAREIWRGK